MENKQDILKQLSSNDMDIVRGAIEQIKQEGDIFHRPRITGHPVTKSGHEHHYQPHGLTLGRERIRLQNGLDG